MRFILFVVALCVSACAAEHEEGMEHMLLGQTLPDVELLTLGAEPETLYARWPDAAAAKPVVVNVWATWCAPCVRELPMLLALQQSGTVKLLTIATDSDAQKVQHFLQEQNMQALNVLHDKRGSITRGAWQVRALPQTFIMAPDKTVVRVIAGERDWAHPRMQTLIQQWVEEATK